MRAHGLLGIHVHRGHEPARLVCADRHQRDVDRRHALTDVGEVRRVAGIANEVERDPVDAHDVAAPQRPVAVPRRARGEVLRRHARDLRRTHFRGLPPVELVDVLAPSSPRGHHAPQAKRRDERRTVADSTERRRLEMIVVVVTDEHEIDRRQG